MELMMDNLVRLVLIVFLIPIMVGGCSNFGQTRMQRVQMPVSEDNRSVSLDDENKVQTQVIVKAETQSKKTPEINSKAPESQKDQKVLKAEDLPPALKLLSLKSEQEAKEKQDANTPAPLSIPPPPTEAEKEIFNKNEKTISETKAPKIMEPLEIKSEKPVLETSQVKEEAKTKPEIKPIQEVATLPAGAIALKQIIENKPELASKTLKESTPQNSEIIEFLLTAAGLVLKNENLDSKVASQTLQEISKAQEKLRKKADLSLENIHFCKDVHGFGSFDPLPSNHGFHQGKGNLPGEKILVYVEVENVHCNNEHGIYESMLSSNLEIHDSQGKVTNMAFPPRIDRSRAQRSDYHLTFQFRVPPKLQPGLYTLWVSVEETAISGQLPRSCKKSIDFRVISSSAQSEE